MSSGLSAPPSRITLPLKYLYVLHIRFTSDAYTHLDFQYLSLKPLPTLLTFLTPTHSNSHSAKTRSRAVYALSGLLKHNSAAVRQLTEANGWKVLKGALGDSDIGVRRKVAFLIGTLVLPAGGEEDLGDDDREAEAGQTTVTEQTPATATSTSTALGPVSTALGPVSSSTAVSRLTVP